MAAVFTKVCGGHAAVGVGVGVLVEVAVLVDVDVGVGVDVLDGVKVGVADATAITSSAPIS